MEPCRLPPWGRLLSYTILQAPAPGFPAPLILGLVALPEGARLLCRGEPGCRPRIHQRVCVVQEEDAYTFTSMSLGAYLGAVWRAWRVKTGAAGGGPSPTADVRPEDGGLLERNHSLPTESTSCPKR